MFLLAYSRCRGAADATGFGRFALMRNSKLYLTNFLNRTFSGENTQNRDFSGREKLKVAAVYRVPINQGAGRSPAGLFLRCLYFSA
jgi:hypothetical protein